MKIIGADALTLVSQNQVWSSDRGARLRTVYKGPPDKAKAAYLSYLNDPAVDEVTCDTLGSGTLEVFINEQTSAGPSPNNEELNVTWEVVPQDVYKDVLQHETFATYATPKNLANVRSEYERGNTDYAAVAGVPTTYQTMLNLNYQQYLRSIAVLVKTVRVGSRSSIVASWKGVDRAWKMNEPNGPNAPTLIIGAVNDLPEYDVTKKQWLKRAPSVRQSGRREFSLVYTWWFARRWSYTFYEGDNETGNP